MTRLQRIKCGSFLLCLSFPFWPFVGWVSGVPWAPAVAFFFGLPLIAAFLPPDHVSLANLSPAAKKQLAWIPRVYVLLYAGMLIWLLGVIPAALRNGQAISLFFSAIIPVAVGSVVAHELMHRREPLDRLMGRSLTILIGYPHLREEHEYHHANVGDAFGRGGAAPINTSVYRYMVEQTWYGLVNAIHGVAIPEARHNSQLLIQPLTNLLLYLGWCGVGAAVGGWKAAIFLCLLSVACILVVEAVNYIQHYGLARGPNQPIDVHLSWEAPCWIANAATLNINYHGMHHVDEWLAFYDLERSEGAPAYPSGYVTMLLLALIPPLFYRAMNRRLIRFERSRLSGQIPEIREAPCVTQTLLDLMSK